MPDKYSITKLQDFVGKRLEIIAFGIYYLGILESVDNEKGTLKIIDGQDFAILELERVESFSLAEARTPKN